MKKTQLAVGIVFLLVGLAIVAAGLHPAIAKPPTAISLPLLLTGLVVSVLGALIIPSSGAGDAIHVLVVNLGTYVPWVGGRRSGDPPADDKP